ncbi:MAG: glycosyltransferase family 4 protein [Candidatus Margulisiibacteriota bacterium]
MKICFLAGSNSIHSYKWINFFANKGHAVSWISLAPSNFGKIEFANYHEIITSPVNIKTVLHAIVKTRKLIKEINPDIIHIHSAGTYGVVGSIAGWGYPQVITVWGSDVILGIKYWLRKLMLKFILSRAALVTCDAEHMLKTMLKLGISKKKIRIINFGIDTHKFCVGNNCGHVREKLKILAAPMIISLRSFEPIYDVSSLIGAIPFVLKEFPDAAFVLAGTGSLDQSLKALVGKLMVGQNVRFIGMLKNDELPAYLQAADLYVSTSLSDAGIAASTAEAMACGLPVVITDSGENNLWVKDGTDGYIVPVSNPVILAERIIHLLRNKELRDRMSARSREIIKMKNDYWTEMEKMDKLYEVVFSVCR